jgi:uncharacterized membrane protein
MDMKEQAEAPRVERRWPALLTIFAVLFLITALPERVRLFPMWFTYGIGIAVLASIAAVGLMAATPRWRRIERTGVLLFVVVKGAANLASLAYLIDLMVRGSVEVGGLTLLASSTAVWATNVLVFSLLYWQIDRGGPEARMAHARPKPDWLFPQEGAPAEDVPPGWRPAFVDYLYLGYSTGTAFSTTDAMPLTSRAKLLMMLESTISLLTVVVVASRAINILGQ